MVSRCFPIHGPHAVCVPVVEAHALLPHLLVLSEDDGAEGRGLQNARHGARDPGACLADFEVHGPQLRHLPTTQEGEGAGHEPPTTGHTTRESML